MFEPTEKVYRALRELKGYIEKNDFDTFYDQLNYGIASRNGGLDLVNPKEVGSITGMFYKTGVLDDVLGNLTYIPCYMFTLVDIPEIEIPSNITKIQGWAFFKSHVKSIKIPESVTKIGPEAFSQCKNLEELTIPRSVTDLSTQSTFYGCDNLKKVWIPSHLRGSVSKSRMCGSSKAITRFIYY